MYINELKHVRHGLRFKCSTTRPPPITSWVPVSPFLVAKLPVTDLRHFKQCERNESLVAGLAQKKPQTGS